LSAVTVARGLARGLGGFVIATNTSKPAYSSDIGMFTLVTKSFIADSWNRSLEHYVQLCWYTFSITEAAIMECF